LLRRVGKAFIALLSGQVLTIVAQLLLVPLFLKFWSVTVYGEWLALSSLVAYLSTFDFGTNMAAVNRMTQAWAKRDVRSYKKTQHTAIAFYLVIAIAGTVILAIAALLMPFPSWLSLKEIGPIDAAWVARLLGIQILWSLPLDLMIDTYRTTGDLATSQWIRNGRQLLQASLTAIALVLGGGVQLVAIVQLVSLAIIASGVLWDLWRRFPDLTPSFAQASLTEARELFRPSSRFFLITLAVTASDQGSVLVISSALGGAAVALFVTSRTLVNLIRQFLGMLNSALWPDVTMMEARNDYGRLRIIHRLLTGAFISISIGYAAVLWVYGAEVISVWTGGKLVADQILLALLLLYAVLRSPWLASSVIPAASNRHRILANAYLASSIVGLVLAVLLVNRLGTWAIPISFMIAEGLFCYHFVVQDACRIVRSTYSTFALRLWATMIVIALATVFAAWLISKEVIVLPHPFQWAITAFLSFIIAGSLSWLLWFDANERSLSLNLASRVKRKLFRHASSPN
jgi:O-antigen/teichoic acid export membrane protein